MDQKTRPAPDRSTLRRCFDGTLGAVWRLADRRLIQPVLKINDSPHALSLGVTMGLFVSLTPTVGIQMPIVFGIGTLIRANRIAAIAMTWISNPVTTLPMYYLYYRLGLALLGREGISYAELEAILADEADRGAWDGITHLFEALGWPLWLGSLLVAVVITAPAYPFLRRYFEGRAAARVRKPEDAEKPGRLGGEGD